MFNEELFKVSQNVFNDPEQMISIDATPILNALINHAKHGYMVNGTLRFIVFGDDYTLFRRLLSDGNLKYFEREYCLYLVGNTIGNYHSSMEFLWDAKEYYMKNYENAKKLIKG